MAWCDSSDMPQQQSVRVSYDGQRSADVRAEHYDRGEDCSLSAVGEHLMYKRKHHYCCREVVKVCAYDECQNGYRP